MMRARMMTLADVAEHTGVKYGTLTGYLSRGQMPAPDEQYGRTPLWKVTTIRKWRKKVDVAQKQS